MCFFDGTSNRAVGPQDVLPTNVFKLNQALTFGFSGVPQITFYFSGVGTRGDTASRATGRGFDQIITEAFINLASNYMDGDTIYLIGFSRGAAAARAISEMISDPGLLHADHLEVFPELWRYFVDTSLGQGARDLIRGKLYGKLLNPRPKVEFLAAFDAVAGTSWDRGRLFSKVRIRNPRLDSSVNHAVHLLSIDDDRNPSFSPLLWEGTSHPSQVLEQIWMPGVHADVGGSSDGTFLGTVALLTMIDRMAQCCPELEWDTSYIDKLTTKLRDDYRVEISHERSGILRKLLWRDLRVVGRRVEHERIHPVFNLLKDQEFLIRGARARYSPQNYTGGLDSLELSDNHLSFLKDACSRSLAR